MTRMILLLALPCLLCSRTLVIVSPHGDDFAIYAGGAIAKMIDEGFTAYLVRVTNDEKHSTGLSMEETRVRTAAESEAAAKIIGIREVIHLNFKDGELDPISETELRARFIQLFRALKPDAVMTTDPWTRYDDNFDHQKVGRAVEDACWTGGNDKFHPEMNRAGLPTHGVRDRYYWSAGQRYANHTVDVSATLERKKRALAAMPTLTGFRPRRLKGRDAASEEFHYTQGSGIQNPYVAWHEQQLKSGKEWGSPAGTARVVVPERAKHTLAIVSPHADDWSIFAGGTIARMIQSGYTVYLIRVTNDEKDSYGLGLGAGETIRRNAEEVEQAARIIGIREAIGLNLKNDELDPVSHTELRGRLILLFRLLKPDALMTYDPWSLYERNPDHVKVARAAAEAAWAAGVEQFNPEHRALGLKPHTVRERYYFSRGPSDLNRVFDISSTMDLKLRAIKAHKTMMQSTANKLRDQLKIAGLRLPLLEKKRDSFWIDMVDVFNRERAERAGKPHGLKYAELFRFESEE
jgi:LmbE family N-acetylglucosaminyl deacetylase